uniref:Outer capsid protein VP5 n=1 Tax=Changuinola virus TaxID=40052 RepID=A0A2S0NS13_9REOV|nr:VP5 [Changuinola virus]AVV63156.1 VP5 [Changuinola virus]
MGKIIKALNKFGKKTWDALNSNTAKKIYSTIGRAAEKAANSEIGSAAIDGLIQGSVQSILTGESYGETVKQAVLLNIMGGSETIPDPLSPGEQSVIKELTTLKEKEKQEQIYNKYHTQVEKILGDEIVKVRKYVTDEAQVETQEENQIEMLQKALVGYGKIIDHEIKGVDKLSHALKKEIIDRTETEQKMVVEYRNKIDALEQAVEVEKEAMNEEAIQELISMSTDIVEAAAEEVPIFGAATAVAVASGRAVEGAYKLKQVISMLTGIDLSHLKTPTIQPETLRAILDKKEGVPIEDARLARGLDHKLETLKENINEVRHMQSEIVPAIEKAAKEDAKLLGINEKYIHPRTAMRFKIPIAEQPLIHIYAAPWDSDTVFMFHCIPPHHQPTSFLLGFDLDIEYVFYEDLTASKHILRKGAQVITGRSFQQSYQEFLMLASNIEGGGEIHKRRLLRSQQNHPIYMGNIHYEISYNQLLFNAMELVHNQELQAHVLRGPIHFQRRSILGALKYGIEILGQPLDMKTFLRDV